MIRIANRQRKRFKINSNSDDKELIKLSSDNEVKINDKDKDETDKDEADKKAKVKKSQISAAGRPLRNTTLPVRYRDSQIRPSAKSNIQKFEIER